MNDSPRPDAVPDPEPRRSPAFAVFRMGLPLALGLASHALVNLVDLLLVGRLGEVAVQAAHVASTWNFLPMILGNCVATALLARLARLLGRNERGLARCVHRRAEWFAVWLGVAVSVVSALAAPWMVETTGLSGTVATDALHYLVVSNLGCLPMFVLMQTTAAMRAAGEIAMPLALLVGANLLNLGLDVVLLFGWEPLGIPAVGVAGAAYASVAARAVAAVVAWWWLRDGSHVLSLRAAEHRTGVAVAVPLLHDAWPQIVQIGLRAALVLALTVVVQREHGDAATAALGVATRLDTVILFASLGFANAATVVAGRAVVVGDERTARAAGWWAAVQAGAFGLLVALLLRAFPAEVTALFVPAAPAAMVALVALYFRTAIFAQVLSATTLGAIGAVHGAGRMVAPLVVDLLAFAVAFLLLAAAAERGLEALYGALVLGMAVTGLLHLAFVALGRWPRPLPADAPPSLSD